MRKEDAALRRLGTRAIERYDLREPRVSTLSTRTNLILRVDAQPGRSRKPQRFVLRVYRPNYHTDAALRSEQMWVRAASKATGVVMPQAVPNRDGDVITIVRLEEVPGARRCVLTRWIEGRDRTKSLTPTILGALGETMARVHNFAEGFGPPCGFVRPRWDYDRLFGPAYQRGALWPHVPAAQGRFIERARKFIGERLRELGESRSVFGMIHSDMHPWNVVVHRGEVRVLDTEDCGWGHYAFDVGVVLFELLQTWPQRYGFMRDSFLGGYRNVRAIAGEPRDVAPFFAMRMVDIALWHAQVGRPHRIRPWVEFCSAALRGMVK